MRHWSIGYLVHAITLTAEIIFVIVLGTSIILGAPLIFFASLGLRIIHALLAPEEES